MGFTHLAPRSPRDTEKKPLANDGKGRGILPTHALRPVQPGTLQKARATNLLPNMDGPVSHPHSFHPLKKSKFNGWTGPCGPRLSSTETIRLFLQSFDLARLHQGTDKRWTLESHVHKSVRGVNTTTKENMAKGQDTCSRGNNRGRGKSETRQRQARRHLLHQHSCHANQAHLNCSQPIKQGQHGDSHCKTDCLGLQRRSGGGVELRTNCVWA